MKRALSPGFDRFCTGGSRQQTGSALGLAIVRRIAELHDEALELLSRFIDRCATNHASSN